MARYERHASARDAKLDGATRRSWRTFERTQRVLRYLYVAACLVIRRALLHPSCLFNEQPHGFLCSDASLDERPSRHQELAARGCQASSLGAFFRPFHAHFRSSASPVEEGNLFVWTATICGPDETPWEVRRFMTKSGRPPALLHGGKAALRPWEERLRERQRSVESDGGQRLRTQRLCWPVAAATRRCNSCTAPRASHTRRCQRF